MVPTMERAATSTRATVPASALATNAISNGAGWLCAAPAVKRSGLQIVTSTTIALAASARSVVMPKDRIFDILEEV